FVELANIRRTSGINKTRRLSHVDIFLKKPMEKGIFDVKLTKGPTTRNCKAENSTNDGRLDNRTEGFSIVYARTLMKTLGNETSFVAFNGAIRVTLDPKNPLAANQVLRRK
ncbi:unnamed protein product, partial [Prunus brigantina]